MLRLAFAAFVGDEEGLTGFQSELDLEALHFRRRDQQRSEPLDEVLSELAVGVGTLAVRQALITINSSSPCRT